MRRMLFTIFKYVFIVPEIFKLLKYANQSSDTETVSDDVIYSTKF